MKFYEASATVAAEPVREEYTGPLISMIWKSMPDLGPSFQQFVSGLKHKAEAG
jgi:hypothetical protein